MCLLIDERFPRPTHHSDVCFEVSFPISSGKVKVTAPIMLAVLPRGSDYYTFLTNQSFALLTVLHLGEFREFTLNNWLTISLQHMHLYVKSRLALDLMIMGKTCLQCIRVLVSNQRSALCVQVKSPSFEGLFFHIFVLNTFQFGDEMNYM